MVGSNWISPDRLHASLGWDMMAGFSTRAKWRSPECLGRVSGASVPKKCLTAPTLLEMALLVHTQHQGAVGRVEVKADDVANLVDEQRITAQLEGLAAMRLQGKSAPDAADAALAESGGVSQRARGPVSGGLGLGFQGARQHAFHRGIAQAARRARTGFIEQPVEAEKNKTLAPLAHRGQ